MKTSKTLAERAEYLNALASICELLEERRGWYTQTDGNGEELVPTPDDGYSFTAYNAYSKVLEAVEKIAKA